MKNRKFKLAILSIIVSISVAACTSTGARKPSSVDGGMEHQIGREPASMRGNFTWLDQVEDDFGRIASETSNRTVASEQEHQTYIKQKKWSFSYSEKTNSFFVKIGDQNYKMIQSSIGDGESYAFAAEGQTENPVTLSVIQKTGREVASGSTCQAELNYWNADSRVYMKEQARLQGKSCNKLVSRLKDYVP